MLDFYAVLEAGEVLESDATQKHLLLAQYAIEQNLQKERAQRGYLRTSTVWGINRRAVIGVALRPAVRNV
jgi:hypothetical protein